MHLKFRIVLIKQICFFSSLFSPLVAWFVIIVLSKIRVRMVDVSTNLYFSRSFLFLFFRSTLDIYLVRCYCLSTISTRHQQNCNEDDDDDDDDDASFFLFFFSSLRLDRARRLLVLIVVRSSMWTHVQIQRYDLIIIELDFSSSSDLNERIFSTNSNANRRRKILGFCPMELFDNDRF